MFEENFTLLENSMKYTLALMHYLDLIELQL